MQDPQLVRNSMELVDTPQRFLSISLRAVIPQDLVMAEKEPANGALFGRESRWMAQGMGSIAEDRAKKETVMAQGFGSEIPVLETRFWPMPFSRHGGFDRIIP